MRRTPLKDLGVRLPPLKVTDSRRVIYTHEAHRRVVDDWVHMNLDGNCKVVGVHEPQQMAGIRAGVFVRIRPEIDLRRDREADGLEEVARAYGYTIVTIDDEATRQRWGHGR